MTTLKELEALADRFMADTTSNSYFQEDPWLKLRSDDLRRYGFGEHPKLSARAPLEWIMSRHSKPLFDRRDLRQRRQPPDNYGELSLYKYYSPKKRTLAPVYCLQTSTSDNEGNATGVAEEVWFSRDHGVFVVKQIGRSAHDWWVDYESSHQYNDAQRQLLQIMKETGYIDDPKDRIKMWLSAGDPVRGIPSEDDWPGLWRPQK